MTSQTLLFEYVRPSSGCPSKGKTSHNRPVRPRSRFVRRLNLVLPHPCRPSPPPTTCRRAAISPISTAAAQACRGCDLFENATQTVFGQGPADARLMLVGEQPGDREDVAGEPFVGPAGKLLDKALRRGADRSRTRVRHQRRQALQVRRGRARSAPYPQDAQPHRGGVVPALAVRRTRGGHPRRRRPARRDSGESSAGQRLPARPRIVERCCGCLPTTRPGTSIRRSSPRCIRRRCCAARPRRGEESFASLVADLRFAATLLSG